MASGWAGVWEAGLPGPGPVPCGQQLYAGPQRRTSSASLPHFTYLGLLLLVILGTHRPTQAHVTSGTISMGRWALLSPCLLMGHLTVGSSWDSGSQNSGEWCSSSPSITLKVFGSLLPVSVPSDNTTSYHSGSFIASLENTGGCHLLSTYPRYIVFIVLKERDMTFLYFGKSKILYTQWYMTSFAPSWYQRMCIWIKLSQRDLKM